MWRDPTDSNKFTIYQVFKDEDAIKYHESTKHFEECKKMADSDWVISVTRIVNQSVNYTY